MTDSNQVVFSLNGSGSGANRLGLYDDFSAGESGSGDFAGGLISLGYIKAAVRRSTWFLLIMTVIGLFGGVGAYVTAPHEYQASASILITLSPYEQPQSAPSNNQALVETRAVAGIAVQALGLKTSVSSFLSTYTATSITAQLLSVTATAPSASQAVRRANAVSTAFLKFRADELQAEQNLVLQSLNQQVNQAQQSINSINAKVSQLTSQPTSATQQSQITKLRAQVSPDTAMLTALQGAVVAAQTTTQPEVAAAVKGSQILTVVPLSPPSKLKTLIRYAGIGLIVGLALGLGIVVLRALASDRLRRRDDIAYALDAPVKLSVYTLRPRRRRPAWPGRKSKRNRDMRRVIAHLRSAVPRSTQGPAGLAIVAVDNAALAARALAALATAQASQGLQVVVADLSRGAHLAHLLGVKGPGAHPVRREGVNFTMTVPDRHDPAPIGPLPSGTHPARPAPAEDPLGASYASADLLLTLVTLDPAVGGEHLATWATTAVVLVGAGQSSAQRIHSVGEMIRLAGTRLDSVVLIGADRDDASLGLMRRPDEQAGVGALGR